MARVRALWFRVAIIVGLIASVAIAAGANNQW